MLQVKFISGNSLEDLSENLNKALSSIQSEKTEISYDTPNHQAIIQYETYEAYKDRLCCECAHWDDDGKSSTLICFCTMTGKRMRYNCHACPSYKDVRG